MMNLRRAQMDVHWKTAFRRNYSPTISSVTYENSEIFKGLNISFKPGINALVGRNGIGKSNLIRSLYNIFFNIESNREKFKTPLLNSSVIRTSIDINSDAKEFIFESSAVERISPATGFMFDPCTLIPAVQNLFVEQANLEEFLDGYSAIELKNDDLKLINFLTSGNYKTVKVFNIEDEYENFPKLPFFVVTTSDSTYDSRNMGLGELSLFYFYWLKSYMEKISAERILFIEEPESFLPPSAQERLADVLAMIAATEGIPIILSSHSEHILKRIPRSHTQIMKKRDGQTTCSTAIDDAEPLRLLGLTSNKIGFLMFEDIAALAFFKSVIKKSSKYNADRFYLHISGSDGEVLKDLLQLPHVIDEFSFIGVFDGDAKGKFEKQLSDQTNFCFLPGKLAPEEVLIQTLLEATPDNLARCFGVKLSELTDAKDSVAGTDHHDYFHELGRALGKTYLEVISRAADLWTERNDQLALEFVATVENILALVREKRVS